MTRRRHGLFPPRDLLLAELASRSGSHPFEKHMAGARSSYQPLPHGGWTTGDSACRAGLDLRMFYQVHFACAAMDEHARRWIGLLPCEPRACFTARCALQIRLHVCMASVSCADSRARAWTRLLA